MADTIKIIAVDNEPGGALHIRFIHNGASGHGLRFTGGFQALRDWMQGDGELEPAALVIRHAIKMAIARGATTPAQVVTALLNRPVTLDYSQSPPMSVGAVTP